MESKCKFYSGRKKKCTKVFCSHFMSFYPMELIFIGWVGDIWEFYWVLRNFEFKPANEIFWQKGKFPAFQKVLFLGVSCRKLSLNKIGVMNMSYIMDSGQNRLYTTFPNIFLLLSADPADLSYIQKNHYFFGGRGNVFNCVIAPPDRLILMDKC